MYSTYMATDCTCSKTLLGKALAGIVSAAKLFRESNSCFKAFKRHLHYSFSFSACGFQLPFLLVTLDFN